MKSLIYLAALACLLITLSCERVGIQTAQAVADDVTQQLTLRNTINDCDDCDLDMECCCILYIDYGMGPQLPTTILVCGFSKGANTCGPYFPGGNCPPVAGVEHVILFNSIHLSEYLCMRKGRAFRVFNNSAHTVTLRLNCKADGKSPGGVGFTLEPSEEIFLNTDGNCDMEEC